jgi:hypothetical protein
MDEYWSQFAMMFVPKFILIGVLVWYTWKLKAEVRAAKRAKGE